MSAAATRALAAAVVVAWFAMAVGLAHARPVPAAAPGAEPSPKGDSAAERVAPRAEDAEPDTSVDEFLETLADSTQQYFGIAGAPRDTAGLDSALAFGLAHPKAHQRRTFHLTALPTFEFNRADGPVWGGQVSIGSARQWVRLTGEAGYAAGPNDWVGGGEIRKSWVAAERAWSARASAGRKTMGMDRDHSELHLATVRALLAGKDRKHYFRRDGLEVELGVESPTGRASVGFRDMLETPLATTTTWNLARREPSIVANLPAARGRVNELEVVAGLHVPGTPILVEVAHMNSGPWSKSDFDYRRTRVAGAADIGLGRHASLVPQALYGNLTGEPIPQEAFYLGGSHSLRSLPAAARGGTRMILGRLDLIGADDILAIAHIPHPQALPLQAGLFAASGAVWGADPYGGPTRGASSGPARSDWLHEAGLSLLYQPGIPDPLSFIRLNYAFPLGPHRESDHWTITFSRAIDLVKPFGND